MRALRLSIILPVLSSVVGVAGGASAQGPTAEDGTPSEDAILVDWMAHSREVASLRQQIGAARFDVVTATAWPNPQVQLATSIVVAGRDHPPDGVYNVGPQVTFPLPILGQLEARRNAAMAALGVAEVNVLATLWSRAADIKDAMLAEAFADARVLAVNRNLAELAIIAEIVRTRAAAGANPRYDVLRVSTTEATFRAALSSAQIERTRSEAKLLALLSTPRLASLRVSRVGLAPFHGPLVEDELVRLALQRRPDLELARRQVLAAEATASRYGRENVPVPSVYVGTYHTFELPSVSLQAGLSFNLPIFDRNRGPIGRARAEAAGGLALAEGLEATIAAEVKGAWRARQASAAGLEEFRRVGLANNAELLDRAIVSYKAGAFGILDLLDAYRAAWDARAQELDLELAFAQAEAEVERAAALVTPTLLDAGRGR